VEWSGDDKVEGWMIRTGRLRPRAGWLAVRTDAMARCGEREGRGGNAGLV
jgi:hypothetical protein